MAEFLDARGLGGGVVFLDLAEVGEDVAFQQAAVGARGGDVGDVGGGDAVDVEERFNGWVERVFLRSGLAVG